VIGSVLDMQLSSSTAALAWDNTLRLTRTRTRSSLRRSACRPYGSCANCDIAISKRRCWRGGLFSVRGL